jgi:hypothetical protein
MGEIFFKEILAKRVTFFGLLTQPSVLLCRFVINFLCYLLDVCTVYFVEFLFCLSKQSTICINNIIFHFINYVTSSVHNTRLPEDDV